MTNGFDRAMHTNELNGYNRSCTLEQSDSLMHWKDLKMICTLTTNRSKGLLESVGSLPAPRPLVRLSAAISAVDWYVKLDTSAGHFV